MHDYTPGQRWISDAELQMGLGTVLSVEPRTVTLLFLASGETRTYARQGAPLTRIAFTVGDTVESHEGWCLRIEQIVEHNGLLSYIGRRDDGTVATLDEGELSSFIQLNRPGQRLANGQFDTNRLFELRYRTHLEQARLAGSALRGLVGGRTSPIPHQLYVAHEVASRHAPRVLLADEVGLGKTIEAGMILHQQLLSGRARRVLILLPESLLHQWLVEMVRRFNLRFTLLDEARCLAIEESGVVANPFHAEQLIICGLALLRDHPQRLRQALAGEWELLVVDEAHHLAWAPDEASSEYRIVEQLAAGTPGLLLLTATPEQLGKASHFARLRLLDPDRFHDYATFLAEEQGYAPIAHAIEQLLEGGVLDNAAHATLMETADEGENRRLIEALDGEEDSQARMALVDHLLDRHGTGRVLFRNTRAAVQGFPERRLHPQPLPLPEGYRTVLEALQRAGLAEPQRLLCPERLYRAEGGGSPPWSQIDPRLDWLDTTLRRLRPAKVLLITATAETALELAEALRLRSGLHAGVFHEGMSIIERDRAAAWFADLDYGGQLLICSEIGSEGRNFQFAHHLVLFDLPLNPDLLEQRIGRLDRIGQQHTIEIHIPYLEGSGQQLMFHWYHQGLGAFEQNRPAARAVYAQLEPTLIEALHQIDDGLEDLPSLLETTRRLHEQLNLELQAGRDRLLEYNACRPATAEALCEAAQRLDHETQLPDYLEPLFDAFGVESEPHTATSLIIRPGEQMAAGSLPELGDEGMVVTTDRATALANEDMAFLTWEHPLVSGAMEAITGSELGNCAVTALRSPRIEPGRLLLELIYLVEGVSERSLQIERYLPPTPLRIVIVDDGREITDDIPHNEIGSQRERLERGAATRIVHAYGEALRTLLDTGEQIARDRAAATLAAARSQAHTSLGREIERLTALSAINPNVRYEEIAYLERALAAVSAAIDAAAPRLDAVRMVVSI